MTISGHGLGYSIYKHQSFNNMLHFMSLSMFLKYFLPNSLLDIHTKISVCCMSVSQLCLTLCVPMGCSPPGSSVHGFLQARILEWFAISSLQGIFLTQELNPSLLLCRQILSHLSHQGSPPLNIGRRWVRLL